MTLSSRLCHYAIILCLNTCDRLTNHFVYDKLAGSKLFIVSFVIV